MIAAYCDSLLIGYIDCNLTEKDVPKFIELNITSGSENEYGDVRAPRQVCLVLQTLSEHIPDDTENNTIYNLTGSKRKMLQMDSLSWSRDEAGMGINRKFLAVSVTPEIYEKIFDFDYFIPESSEMPDIFPTNDSLDDSFCVQINV